MFYLNCSLVGYFIKHVTYFLFEIDRFMPSSNSVTPLLHALHMDTCFLFRSSTSDQSVLYLQKVAIQDRNRFTGQYLFLNNTCIVTFV